MTNNIIHFLWSAAIGDLSVTGSVDDPLKRYKLIYISLISNEYYLLLFFGNPIFRSCRHELIKQNHNLINSNQFLCILVYPFNNITS